MHKFIVNMTTDLLIFFIQNLEIREKNYQIEFSILEGMRIYVGECNFDFNKMIDRIMIN